MGRVLFVFVAVASSSLPSLAPAEDGRPMRDWPSARLRGSTPEPPPCSCRGPTGSVLVGENACLTTPTGSRRARCVMVQNNTSWAVSTDTCGSVALLAR